MREADEKRYGATDATFPPEPDAKIMDRRRYDKIMERRYRVMRKIFARQKEALANDDGNATNDVQRFLSENEAIRRAFRIWQKEAEQSNRAKGEGLLREDARREPPRERKGKKREALRPDHRKAMEKRWTSSTLWHEQQAKLKTEWDPTSYAVLGSSFDYLPSKILKPGIFESGGLTNASWKILKDTKVRNTIVVSVVECLSKEPTKFNKWLTEPARSEILKAVVKALLKMKKTPGYRTAATKADEILNSKG
jgi:hypothetical protein